LEGEFPGKSWFNVGDSRLLDSTTSYIEPRHNTKVVDIPKYSGRQPPRDYADVKVSSTRKLNVLTLRAYMY
jgi:hypothetical protein